MSRSLARAAAALFAGAVVLPVASCSLEVGGQATAIEDAALPDVGTIDGAPEDSAATDARLEASQDARTEAGNDAGNEAGDATADTNVDACLPLPTGWSVAQVVTGGSCSAGFTGPIAFVENPSVGAAPCTCSCGAQASNPCHHAGTVALRVHIAGNGGACNTPGSVGSVGTCQAITSWDTGVDMLTGSPEPPVNVACAAIETKPAIAATSTLDACLVPGFGDAGAGASACLPAGSGACLAKAGVEPVCPNGFSNRRVVTRATDIVDQRTCAACTCNTTATSCTNATLSFFTLNANCGGSTTHVAQLNGFCSAFDGNFNPQSARYDATPSPNACAFTSATSALGGTVTSAAFTTLCCAP